MASRIARLVLISSALFFKLDAATPAEYRQKLGVYVWGKLGGNLEAAAVDTKRLGATGAVRVYIGPRASWDAAGEEDYSALDVKVRRADYRNFLAQFPVVMFTAYDSASFERYKRERLNASQLAATKEEFRRFTLEIARTPGKKIISNWEFENDCPTGQFFACQEYYQARLDGIIEGRKTAKNAGYPGEILTSFEFTIVPGFPDRPSGLVEVATRLKGLDFLSYSAWWSIGWDADAGRVYKDFEYVVPLLRRWALENRLTTRLIIGEFGEYWNMHPTAERMKALVDASIANGAEYLFNWVLYDQPGEVDEWGRDASHFGKYDLNRVLTPQGRELQRWFQPAKRRTPAKAQPKSRAAQPIR